MKLEEQVVSLELAKKLKELGVKQESLFWWTGREDCFQLRQTEQLVKETKGTSIILGETYPAFTVAELLHISPASTSILKRTDLETNSIPRYYVETFEHYRESDWHENPANALARMLIYLLENKLI